MSHFFGSSCCETVSQPSYKNFRLFEAITIANHTILKVLYPDCKNYEGTKILVYKSSDLGDIRFIKELDPHFCDKHISPIARFVPTDEGMRMALKFVNSIAGI